jgi:hypothetical protein
MPVPLATLSTAQARLASNAQTALAQLDAPVLLRLWHLMSLDAPTVAVIWSLSFAWAAGVHLPRWIPVLLALGTWAVYVGDRLLDTRSALRSGISSTGTIDESSFRWPALPQSWQLQSFFP